MMRTSIIAFILFFCFNIHAHNIILEGIVYDAKYRIPISNANVFIDNTSIGTTTSSLGEFYLSVDDSLFNHNLIVITEGYESMQIPIKIVYAPFIEIFLESNYQDSSNNIADKRAKFVNLLDKALTFVMNDWVPIGKKSTNKFDFGRLQTIPTINPIEGLRLRGGIASNSRLSPHFFVKGYTAYGFKDRKFKYRGELVYSFDKKDYFDSEYPKNNINLIYENDIYSPGEMHPRATNDLLLVTYRRSENETTYRNFAEINYEKEYKNGLNHSVWLRKSKLKPQGDLVFSKMSEVKHIKQIINTEVGVTFSWSGNNPYGQSGRRRIPLNITSPILLFSHTIGLKGFMGGETSYHRSEISLQKRFKLSDMATLDVVGEFSKVWSQVPFPLLVYPNQRNRINIENNAFFLSRSLEFAADQQATLRSVIVGQNLMFSKIPILKAIGFNELISFRATYGSLSNKNLPSQTNELLIYPYSMNEYKKGTPYIEGTIGITNIFELLRLEYVHRFNYRNTPNAILGAVRLDITI